MKTLTLKLFSYDTDGAPLYLAHIAGLSTDSKPTSGLVSGSTFIEVDTGLEYVLDAESDTKAWTPKVVTTTAAQ